MISVTLSPEIGEYLARMRAEVARSIARAMPEISTAAAKALGDTIRRTFPRGSGRLAASVVASSTATTASAGPTAPQADILDRGGTISGRRGMLAIPFTGAGVGARRPREWGKGVLFSVPGKGILAARQGRGIAPKYILRPTVTIRPHPYLDAADANLARAEQPIADAAVDRIAEA